AQTLALHENDKLILYSDGLTEAWSESDEEFGTERLELAIQNAQQNQIFDNLLNQLDQFCGTRTQADDVTLIEINCIPGLLPKIETHETLPKKEHDFKSKGDWEYIFNLKNKRLRETNPVPIIINQIMEMEGIESERQSLFIILTELYVNALDHGVLGLDSALKSDPSGFALYFKSRENLLDQLTHGYVIIHIAVEQSENVRSIMVRIEDSGNGFDHKNLPMPDLKNHTGLAGRGIMLVKDLCESLTYTGKGNISEAIYSWKTG
ncbi:MAG: SpoIIE family protein phosphatase, partial [Bacteroidota bacterium]